MLVYLSMLETEQEKSKFELIYEQYAGLMYYVARQILDDHHDAEDAVHQAFLAIIKNFKKISQVKCPQTRSYIVIITESKAIDILRARRNPVELDCINEPGLSVPAPGDGGLADAMARLPARYREVLLLRFHHGYSTRELAEMLDMTRPAVQKLIYRAREALRKLYDDGGETHE